MTSPWRCETVATRVNAPSDQRNLFGSLSQRHRLTHLFAPECLSSNKNLTSRRKTELTPLSHLINVVMVTSNTSLFMSQNAYVNINRIMSVASRLAEAGHYASTQIKQISAQLDQDWKSFAAALDERSTILAMSSVFHQKAEQVRRRDVPSFSGGSFLPVTSPSLPALLNSFSLSIMLLHCLFSEGWHGNSWG